MDVDVFKDWIVLQLVCCDRFHGKTQNTTKSKGNVWQWLPVGSTVHAHSSIPYWDLDCNSQKHWMHHGLVDKCNAPSQFMGLCLHQKANVDWFCFFGAIWTSSSYKTLSFETIFHHLFAPFSQAKFGRGKSSVELEVFEDPAINFEIAKLTPSPQKPAGLPYDQFLKGIINHTIDNLPDNCKQRLKNLGKKIVEANDSLTDLHMSVATLCSGSDGAIDTLEAHWKRATVHGCSFSEAMCFLGQVTCQS